jgi:tetrahydromethanopterin S-methyltransferase subunit G
MESETDEVCRIKDRLQNLVQHILFEIATLSREEAEILKTGDQKRINEIDKRLENLVGEKERALGAVKQHRTEHGC